MKTSEYYKKNPKARAVKAKYDSKLEKRPDQVKKRVEANQAHRDKGDYGHSTKDYDHAVDGFVSASVNRGRKGEGGRKKGIKHNKK